MFDDTHFNEEDNKIPHCNTLNCESLDSGEERAEGLASREDVKISSRPHACTCAVT